ncbi:MAG: hypothetical protein IJ496_00970 [Ruminococcus sp.]|nr:hypothetical protein [Ruminococcus sp.]
METNQNHFTVRSKYAKKSDEILGMSCLAIFAVLCCVGAFLMPKAFYIIIAIMMTALFIVYVVITNNFRIDVSGTNFKVRTKAGKKYEFDASEIEKVTCDKSYSSKRGYSFYLHISAKGKKIDLSITNQGTQQMAGYLLRMYECGVLNQKAVSEHCKNELARYSSGHYTRIDRERDKKVNLILFGIIAVMFGIPIVVLIVEQLGK